MKKTGFILITLPQQQGFTSKALINVSHILSVEPTGQGKGCTIYLANVPKDLNLVSYLPNESFEDVLELIKQATIQ